MHKSAETHGLSPSGFEPGLIREAAVQAEVARLAIQEPFDGADLIALAAIGAVRQAAATLESSQHNGALL